MTKRETVKNWIVEHKTQIAVVTVGAITGVVVYVFINQNASQPKRDQIGDEYKMTEEEVVGWLQQQSVDMSLNELDRLEAQMALEELTD